MVTATAVMGKTTEALGDPLTGFAADLDDATLLAQFTDPLADPAAILGNATTRFLYDLGAYQRTSAAAQPSPPAAYTLARETHVSDLAAPPPYPGAPQATRYQYHFCYSDGFGREIQHKAQVAPGPLDRGRPAGLAALGRVRLDDLRQQGPAGPQVRAVLLGDERLRVRRADRGQHRRCSTTRPAAWWRRCIRTTAGRRWSSTRGPSSSWDGDDTVLVADPRTDSDVGDYFQRLLGAGPVHVLVRAPHRRHLRRDAAGSSGPAGCGAEGGHGGRDTRGHPLRLARPRLPGGRRQRRRHPVPGPHRLRHARASRWPSSTRWAAGAQEYCYRDPRAGGGFRYLAGTDMAGSPLYRVSADGGARRGLVERRRAARSAAGTPAATRSAWSTTRPSGRPHRYVSTGGAAEILIEPVRLRRGPADGEPVRAAVPRTTTWPAYIENSQYDYKGNLLASVRQLAADYHQAVDWTPLAGLTTAAAARRRRDRGRAGARRRRRPGPFRPAPRLRRAEPAGPGGHAAQRDHAAGRAAARLRRGGLLDQMDVWLQQAAAPAALLDPATADRHAVTGIDYNARGQRVCDHARQRNASPPTTTTRRPSG